MTLTESYGGENLIALVNRLIKIYYTRISSMTSSISLHLGWKRSWMFLRAAWPYRISVASPITFRILPFERAGAKWPLSIKLRSSSIFIWVSSSLPVLTIMEALRCLDSYLIDSTSSCPNEIIQRIGVINSCDTLEVSRESKEFFCSARSRFYWAVKSLTVRIWQTLSLYSMLERDKWAFRHYDLSVICLRLNMASCSSPRIWGFNIISSKDFSLCSFWSPLF